MNLSIGIVGLPNVGKSTLFNALLKKQQALAANYPFATIEPNVGIVPVPDERLEKLAAITKDEEKMVSLPPIKSATVEFVDIAGLVEGASNGEGLGNKFLSHIREVSVICHVVRAFEDPNIIRQGSSDPKNDYVTINTELFLADLQTLEKASLNKNNDATRKAAIVKLSDGLNRGKRPEEAGLTDDEKEKLKDLFLLSAKPMIVVLNVEEASYHADKIEKIQKEYSELLAVLDANVVVICAKVESDLAELSEEEQKEYLAGLGFIQSGLGRLIQKAYGTLGLVSFLTTGEKEVRAWTIRRGATAPEAAGEIHTDFIKKFIKAEVVGYDDFVSLNGWKGSREKGKARLEGKEYVMHDGDIVEFKIGA